MVKEMEDAAPSRTLRVLLLVCAGALIVIIATIVNAIGEAHSKRISQDAIYACGVTVAEYYALPVSWQHRVNELCVDEPNESR